MGENSYLSSRLGARAQVAADLTFAGKLVGARSSYRRVASPAGRVLPATEGNHKGVPSALRTMRGTLPEHIMVSPVQLCNQAAILASSQHRMLTPELPVFVASLELNNIPCNDIDARGFN